LDAPDDLKPRGILRVEAQPVQRTRSRQRDRRPRSRSRVTGTPTSRDLCRVFRTRVLRGQRSVRRRRRHTPRRRCFRACNPLAVVAVVNAATAALIARTRMQSAIAVARLPAIFRAAVRKEKWPQSAERPQTHDQRLRLRAGPGFTPGLRPRQPDNSGY